MPKAVRPASSRLTADQLRKLRVPFVQRALMTHGAGREELFLVDLGVAGAFAERERPLPVGDEVTLSFRLPGNDQEVQAVCRVAWWHGPGERMVSKSLPAGVGLEFVRISDHDRARVRRHLLEHLERDTGGRRFHRPWPLSEGEEGA
jgi:Tfp pilus assembly protein PilZ